jgi:hypothetical protein
MRTALENESRFAATASDLGWTSVDVRLPRTRQLDSQALEDLLADPTRSAKDKIYAASQLIWMRRCDAGDSIDASCLKLGSARVLHLPGELFVEYQLAASQMRPDLFVATAAYGDYAPWYIGTDIAYEQGGYETEARSSLVDRSCETVLVRAIQKLLEAEDRPWPALGVEAAAAETQWAKDNHFLPVP